MNKEQKWFLFIKIPNEEPPHLSGVSLLCYRNSQQSHQIGWCYKVLSEFEYNSRDCIGTNIGGEIKACHYKIKEIINNCLPSLSPVP